MAGLRREPRIQFTEEIGSERVTNCRVFQKELHNGNPNVASDLKMFTLEGVQTIHHSTS
jgi:hypothetical protein